ncbi:hypothetical protein FGU65_14785 [Methanoculleus sp. FWC-SCC1]|uniref:Uncharacterized protein n=1 Tax=Methanoculleus frigidifontis TaxID=2584085 RepID=A0ABT8MDV7_9EURY|nr:hypothetical protein [Methanoculleus sp. FWC-SCC1]MDN7026128.1 hypothetical protein [Methanoculleus sp. FWC-SCC1]
MPEPGTLAYGSGGVLHVMVDAEHYRIDPADVQALLFSGRSASVLQIRVVRGGGAPMGRTTIEGYAALNCTGQAVALHTRAGSYVIPLVSFQRVTRGEAASAPLFPLLPGVTG